MLKEYNNIYMIPVIEDGKVISSINLSNEFFKYYVRQKRNNNFTLIDLKNFRDFLAFVFEYLNKTNNISYVKSAWLIGYKTTNHIYISLKTTKKINITLRNTYKNVIIKNVLISDNSLLILIDLFHINNLNYY